MLGTARADDVLDRLRAVSRTPLEEWRFHPGDLSGPERPDYDDGAWEVVGTDYKWLPPDSRAWYRKRVAIPGKIGGLGSVGATVTLHLRADDDAVVWIDGREVQRFHGSCRPIALATDTTPGESHLVAVRVTNYAVTGQLATAELRSDRAEPVIAAVRTYLSDVDAIRGFVLAGADRIARDAAVEKSVGRIDFGALDCGDGDRFLASIAAAREPLAAVLDPMHAGGRARLAEVRAILGELDSLLAAARERGIDVARPMVGRTVADQFLAFGADDLASERPQVVARGLGVAHDIALSCRRAIDETRGYLDGSRPQVRVPRYRTGPIAIDRGAFVQEGRPHFFTGFGHFAQVRKDIPIFNDYGFNAIQVVIVASRVLPGPDTVDTTDVDALVATLDNAARHDVAVNVLLGPNMPHWAFERYPDLRNDHLRFFGFNVDHPAAREIYAKYLRAVIPAIAGHPALFSIDLTNEPTHEDFSARSQEGFRTALRERHGDIGRLNERWGSDFRSWDEIAVADSLPYQPTLSRADRARWREWCQFNQERFLAFHACMRDEIRAMDPRTPIHCKVMSDAFDSQRHCQWGADFEGFARLDRISGNDCYSYERRGPGEEYAQIWLRQAMYYDFQRSVAPENPISNSENHPIEDGVTRRVSGDHMATMLWQGAIHGQGASTTWVWERNQGGELANNILTRPNCVEAFGRTALDLERLAEEVVALQRAPAEVCLLYSPSSIPLNEPYLDEMRRAYEGLYFLGAPTGFVSERMIADEGDGAFSSCRVLVAPCAGFVADGTIAAVERFVRAGGTLVLAGDALLRDEYGRERARFPFADDGRMPDVDSSWAFGTGVVTCLAAPREPKDWARFGDGILDRAGVARPVRVADDHGNRAWGVACRIVAHDGGYLVYLANLLNRPQAVRLVAEEPIGEAVDLIAGRAAGSLLELEPLLPVLLRVG